MARLRAALIDQVSEYDLRDINRAKGGDMAAAKELLNRVFGRPAAALPPPAEDDEMPLKIVFRTADAPIMRAD